MITISNRGEEDRLEVARPPQVVLVAEVPVGRLSYICA